MGWKNRRRGAEEREKNFAFKREIKKEDNKMKETERQGNIDEEMHGFCFLFSSERNNETRNNEEEKEKSKV